MLSRLLYTSKPLFSYWHAGNISDILVYIGNFLKKFVFIWQVLQDWRLCICGKVLNKFWHFVIWSTLLSPLGQEEHSTSMKNHTWKYVFYHEFRPFWSLILTCHWHVDIVTVCQSSIQHNDSWYFHQRTNGTFNFMHCTLIYAIKTNVRIEDKYTKPMSAESFADCGHNFTLLHFAWISTTVWL